MTEQNNAEQSNTVQTAEEQKKVYSRQQERRELDNYRQTKIERIDRLRYRSTPEVFEVLASALKQTEDGAVRLDDVEVDFDVRFPEDEQGAKAQKMVDRLIQLSEQKDCTVSRTVEHPTNVSFHNLAN